MRRQDTLCAALLLSMTACAPSIDQNSNAVTNAGSQDVILDWNNQFIVAIHNTATNPGDTARLGAIVQGAVYDAVNGITHRYDPLHADFDAPTGARPEAAAAQAAHDTLTALFPSQAAAFDAQLAASLAGIPGASGNPQSIARGQAFGAAVAADILAWRSTDGRSCNPAAPGTTCPNHFGENVVGKWRPVPPQPAGAAAALPQFAGTTIVPWLLASRTQFLFDAPPALDSALYAADVNESAAVGDAASTTRTHAQSETALFYADNSPQHWNKIAVAVATAHPADITDTARTFAVLNAAMADAVIAVWISKFTYNQWRPYHAVRQADLDGNPDTTANPSYVSFIPTPGHQQYGSGHGTVGGAAAEVLASIFGDDVGPFTHTTDTVMPAGFSNTRTNTTFSSVETETNDARVWGGIHFRSTQVRSEQVGRALGAYAVATHFLSASGNKGKISHDHPAGDIVNAESGE